MKARLYSKYVSDVVPAPVSVILALPFEDGFLAIEEQ